MWAFVSHFRRRHLAPAFRNTLFTLYFWVRFAFVSCYLFWFFFRWVNDSLDFETKTKISSRTTKATNGSKLLRLLLVIRLYCMFLFFFALCGCFNSIDLWANIRDYRSQQTDGHDLCQLKSRWTGSASSESLSLSVGLPWIPAQLPADSFRSIRRAQLMRSTARAINQSGLRCPEAITSAIRITCVMPAQTGVYTQRRPTRRKYKYY